MTTRTAEQTVRIIEQGNGFTATGDYVQMDGELYRVVSVDSAIHTDDRRGNYILGQVEAADWEDCAEGDESDCRVEAEES